MDKHVLNPILVLALTLGFTACTEAPKPAAVQTEIQTKSQPPAPVEAVAARTAFFEMYKPARTWATDAAPLSVASGEVEGIKNEAGKAGMWTVVFVSPSRREARTFTYAVADQGATIHKGVSAGGAQQWSGATAKSRPFQVNEFSINSDEAYKAAAEKAAPWVKKHPGKKVTYYLASASRFPAPVWQVLWGDTKNGYLAFVNATTGVVMKGK